MISFQVSHPLQVGGQVVIQALHSLLFLLDAPYACRTPTIPAAKSPPQITSRPACCGVGHGDLGA